HALGLLGGHHDDALARLPNRPTDVSLRLHLGGRTIQPAIGPLGATRRDEDEPERPDRETPAPQARSLVREGSTWRGHRRILTSARRRRRPRRCTPSVSRTRGAPRTSGVGGGTQRRGPSTAAVAGALARREQVAD